MPGNQGLHPEYFSDQELLCTDEIVFKKGLEI
jgi:hypothetical protein